MSQPRWWHYALGLAVSWPGLLALGLVGTVAWLTLSADTLSANRQGPHAKAR